MNAMLDRLLKVFRPAKPYVRHRVVVKNGHYPARMVCRTCLKRKAQKNFAPYRINRPGRGLVSYLNTQCRECTAAYNKRRMETQDRPKKKQRGGHPMAAKKRCVDCLEVKPRVNFAVNKIGVNGDTLYKTRCLPCYTIFYRGVRAKQRRKKDRQDRSNRSLTRMLAALKRE